MSGQQPPPARPWFRLATMIRPPPPTPAPAPATQPNPAPTPPRPPVIRPAFTVGAPAPTPSQPNPNPPPPQQPSPIPSPPKPTPSVAPPTDVVEPREPPTPPPSFSAPPTPPLRQSPRSSPPPTPPQPSSPYKPAIAGSPRRSLTSSPVPTTRAVTPPSSPPKNLKPLEQTSVTPPASPLSPPKKSHYIASPPKSFSPPPSTTTTTMHPPSPLLLPSLKQKPDHDGPPEYNQKTIHVQETIEKPMNSALGLNSRHLNGTGIHTHNSTRKHEMHKKHWNSEDAGKNIITIAGENKGAVMKITPFSHKQHDFGSRHKSLTSNNGQRSESDSEAKNKNQNSNPLLRTPFLNSNVQGVNNSILFNCSISHHDPGIRLTIARKSDREFEIHSKEHKKG